MPRKKSQAPTEISENTEKDRILDVEYSDIMEKSYIDYAMSVIVARALPDIRDGLKPVQRRILYDMRQLGVTSEKPYRKSARIVGDTMGKYHPHGDSSIYGAMTVLAQDFKMGAPLVDGHGNFGSIEGDSPAAQRYTEARLQSLTEDSILEDLDKDTVDFVPNYDETEREPEVLPVRFSNFLVNGSEGIAVGMTTSTPTHNLGEVIDASIAIIKNPKISTEKLMQHIPGPDFPTGGVVANMVELPAVYESGAGKIKIRGKVKVEKGTAGKKKIIISEIPYTMIGAGIGKFLNDVAALVENRTLTGISDISNQSSKEGIRIVLELKKDVDAQNIINILYSKTKLEDTFGVNMLAINKGKPEVLSLKSAIQYSVDFQYELNTRKYKTLLAQALKRKEIEEGLIKACDCIDLIIEILRGSKDRKQAKACMVNNVTTGIRFRTKKSENEAKKLKFTEIQADAILEMRLYKLIGLEIDALKKGHEKTLKEISFCNDVLNNKSSMSKLIIKDLEGIKKKYAAPRKTAIIEAKPAVIKAEKVKETDLVAMADRFGYIHTVDNGTFERNKAAAEESYKYIVPCTSTDRLFVITDAGQSHIFQVKDIPHGKFRDKGAPLENVSTFDGKTEMITGIFSMKYTAKKKLLFCTSKGMMKQVPGSEFDVSRRNTAATKLQPGDKILRVEESGSAETVVLQTEKGYILRFKKASISTMKKSAVGVSGIALTKDDSVKEMYLLNQEEKEGKNVNLGEAAIDLTRIKISGRNTRGSKL